MKKILLSAMLVLAIATTGCSTVKKSEQKGLAIYIYNGFDSEYLLDKKTMENNPNGIIIFYSNF